jgi:ubiquinone/menaquinone biosynthesis C-methylase UbiE
MTPSMDWTAQSGSGPEAYQSFLAPAMFEQFGERLVEAARIEAGDRVLDVACGTGVVSRAAARAAGADGAVTGVDLGAPMLAVAREQRPEEGAAAIEYLEGKADALPVDEGAFDVVTCQQGLQFFEDRPAALRSMRGALADGGRIAVATWGKPEENEGFAAIGAALGRHVSEEAEAMMVSPFSLSDTDELESLISEAGFNDVEVDRLTLTATFAANGDFARKALLAGPVWPAFAEAPPSAQEAVNREVAEALASRTSGATVSFPMTTLVALGHA